MGEGHLEEQVLLLLVEDEAILRFAIQEALESGGFEVLAAPEAEAGFALLTQSDCRISGLITDINLGSGADGWTLARQAREFMAEICVLYITGDSAADWSVKGVPNSVVLQKPFADVQIQTAIATLLNEQSQTS